MADEQRIEDIRRAYDAARFDERTPDEKGFAAIFEDELKPLLKENVGFNLRVAEARERRKRTAYLAAGLIAIGFFPVLVLLNVGAEKVVEITFYTLIFLAILGYAWAVRKRADELDRNHASVMAAVIERFGCRLGRDAASHRPERHGSPIMPPFTRLRVPPEHLEGRFDGHIDFTAVRVVATKRYQKTSVDTFCGWYLHVKLPFAFKGATIIRGRVPVHALPVVRGIEGLRGVDLEDPGFRERFEVVSTDQVEARVILSPDVMRHLAEAKSNDLVPGGLMIALRGASAHVWIPSFATALSDWRPLDPPQLIEDLHESFAELAEIRGFLRDIDVIAESEGFRAQAARNLR